MRRVSLAVLTSLTVSATSPLTAQTLGFDDLDSGTYFTSYSGFTWSGFFVYDGCTYSPDSGYCIGTISPRNIAGSEGGLGGVTGSITAPSPFLFNGAWFTAAWNNGLSLTLDGWNGPTLLFSAFLTLDTVTPQYLTANWNAIDRLDFTAFGGTDSGTPGNGTHFAMDDLTFNSTVAPEPASIMLLATGLVALGLTAVAHRLRNA